VRTMTREPVASIARYVGALSLLAAGAVHLQQYYAVYYRVIPTIGPLFVANFVIAVVLGVVLLAPVQRRAPQLHELAAIGGIVFAAGTIVALEISESRTLFGFHEHGYRAAIVISIAVEAAAIVSLAVYLVSTRASRTPAEHPLAAAS
jgi:hypothetical protein